MLDRNSFMETLRGVAEIVRTSAEPLTREEILGYFNDMELSAEQKEMVFEYLSTPHEEETAETAPETEENVQEEPDTVESHLNYIWKILKEYAGIPKMNLRICMMNFLTVMLRLLMLCPTVCLPM